MVWRISVVSRSKQRIDLYALVGSTLSLPPLTPSRAVGRCCPHEVRSSGLLPLSVFFFFWKHLQGHIQMWSTEYISVWRKVNLTQAAFSETATQDRKDEGACNQLPGNARPELHHHRGSAFIQNRCFLAHLQGQFFIAVGGCDASPTFIEMIHPAAVSGMNECWQPNAL